MDAGHAAALADLRNFNYERIYNRPSSKAQGDAVIKVLDALVEHFVASPHLFADAVPDAGGSGPRRSGLRGRDDRPVRLRHGGSRVLNWPPEQLPKGIRG